MIIKRYLVKNMNEAMTRIRYELGKDAIIISQRKVRESGVKGFFSPKLIEVTVALENKIENEKKEGPELKNSLESIKKYMNNSSTSKESELELEVKEMKDMLNKILKNTEIEYTEDKFQEIINDLDISNEYIEELREVYETSPNPKESLKGRLKEGINVNSEDIKGKVVLIGPTGVGKTTTIAKLAGKLSLIDKKKVGLITIDTYRIGAVEQLKSYAEIMNIPFKVVITMKDMEEAIKSMEDLDVVLIDTTGRSSRNAMQISELRAFVHKAEPDSTIMVVSSITKNKDIKDILKGYNHIGFDKVIVTKLDETSTYGSLYTVAKEGKKPIAFITTGQNVPADIKTPTKDELINLVLGEGLSW